MDQLIKLDLSTELVLSNFSPVFSQCWTTRDSLYISHHLPVPPPSDGEPVHHPVNSRPKVRYCLAINLMRISYCKFMTLWFHSIHHPSLHDHRKSHHPHPTTTLSLSVSSSSPESPLSSTTHPPSHQFVVYPQWNVSGKRSARSSNSPGHPCCCLVGGGWCWEVVGGDGLRGRTSTRLFRFGNSWFNHGNW